MPLDARPLTRCPSGPNIVASPHFLRRCWVDNEDIKALEQRIDQLIAACQRLRQDNQLLRSENENLSQKHTRLVEKTQVARTRIEAMIGRLKSLERST
ncbi:MAG: TIGR02449 family protein [Gammaproteobacteria bacterium]|nr:MAG: TIGR02449 family protein [Gammaproteobacteria bacterium]